MFQTDIINDSDPLTMSRLATAGGVHAQKQMIRERLYPLIKPKQPNLAVKITDMLMKLEHSDILAMLDNQDALQKRVDSYSHFLLQQLPDILKKLQVKHSDPTTARVGNLVATTDVVSIDGDVSTAEADAIAEVAAAVEDAVITDIVARAIAADNAGTVALAKIIATDQADAIPESVVTAQDNAKSVCHYSCKCHS